MGTHLNHVADPIALNQFSGLERLDLLHFYYNTPGTPWPVPGAKGISFGSPNWGTDVKIAVAGTPKKAHLKKDLEYNGNYEMLAGYYKDFVAKVRGITTLGSSHYAIDNRMPDYPVAAIELVQRAENHTNIRQNTIYFDVEFGESAWDNPDGDFQPSIPISIEDIRPWILNPGYGLQILEITGDNTDVDFDFANAICPILLSTVDSDRELADDFAFFVRKLVDDRYVDVTTGWTISDSTDNITFDTAPALNEKWIVATMYQNTVIS